LKSKNKFGKKELVGIFWLYRVLLREERSFLKSAKEKN
jgi:hypothetical protein